MNTSLDSFCCEYNSILTLIHLTPYRYSYQPTCMPFPSAQCVYHIWIRSAGNVSISFSLWRGDRGHGVHCEGVQRKARVQGGSLGSIQPERCVLLPSFYAIFAPKQRKRTTFTNATIFYVFPAGFCYKYAYKVHYSAESVRAPRLYTLSIARPGHAHKLG